MVWVGWPAHAATLLLVVPSLVAARTERVLSVGPRYSDFYHIMDRDDFKAYNRRLSEIMDWGLRNVRLQEPKRGLLEVMSEDWTILPRSLRQTIRNTNGGFKEITARRQAKIDEELRRERARVNKGMDQCGFLVSYYMYNHDGGHVTDQVFRLPKVRPLLPFSKRHIEKYLKRLQSRKFNHMYVGVTQEFEPYGDRPVEDWLRTRGYEGFKVKGSRVLLGKGVDVYAKAKRKIATWGLNDAVGWVKFIEGEDGVNVASSIRAYGLVWVLSPLRKVLCHEKQWGQHGSVAAVAVSTLQGHLLQGEERFSVCYEGSGGNVYFDVLSFSKGAPPLGAVLMPLIRPLQGAFMKDISRAMQQHVMLP